MKELHDVSLVKYTSIRIGGTAKRMFIPESVEDLIELMKLDTPINMLGGYKSPYKQ